MKLESHCHSKYSFDSESRIKDIVRQCKKTGIDGMIICDHDVYGLSKEEEKLFKEAGIKLFKAIEFTTAEGTHIIGVHDDIKTLQRDRGAYSVITLIRTLKEIGAEIIIPHPEHETGLIGNKNVNRKDMLNALKEATYVESDSYRYGATKSIEIIRYRFPQLKELIGSDAHLVSDVGAFYSVVEGDFFSDIQVLSHEKTKERSGLYWSIRRVKRSRGYQVILNLIPADLRKNIKSCLRKNKVLR